MADKQYKVRLAKTFQTHVQPGMRLTSMRHTRGGVSLSTENPEFTGPLTKDQVEAIKNDPAFEIKSISSNEAKTAETVAPTDTDEKAKADDESKAKADEDSTATPKEGDSNSDEEVETVDLTAERKSLLQGTREALVAIAVEAGVEVADTDTKADIADKYFAKKAEIKE